jgi:hypothetical protein
MRVMVGRGLDLTGFARFARLARKCKKIDKIRNAKQHIYILGVNSR